MIITFQVGNLLKLILTKERKKSETGGSHFDPKCAIFVCNLWDLIKEKEQDLVYRNVVDRLGSYWPGITEHQVLRFSAKKAKDELSINDRYVTAHYKGVLHAIETLFTTALDRRVQNTYRYVMRSLPR